MITAASLLLATFAAAYGLTWVVRHYAVVREILDVPNARSSHSVPTPRGGGLAITAALVAGTAVAALLGLIPGRTGLVLAGGSAVIAALGWIDDHVSLRVAVRIPVQALVAVGSVAVLGGMPSLRWGGGAVELGLFGSAIAVVGVLWSTNLYNFMDGVDGIAGVQGISMGALGALFLLYAGAGDLALMAGLLAAATAGFLPWNWQPAKIFMGDVGSAMLGYALAVLALASENAGAVPLIAWAGLYGVFAVDATVTVLRRGMRGQRVSEAHRQHAYQRLTQAGWSHAKVSLAVLAMNLLLGAVLFGGIAVARFLPAALGIALLIPSAAYVLVERSRPMDAAAAAATAEVTPSRSRKPAARA